MRVLITGGLGYLGGRLAKYLASDTSNTVIIGTRKNITSLEWLPKVKIVNTVWSSSRELAKICYDIDIVIHCAGMNAEDCFENPSLASEVNGISSNRILQASIKQKVKRFIYLSTAHVYSSPLEGEITELSPCKNTHPYASSHKEGEEAVRFAHSIGEIEGVVVRLSNSFGPPAHIQTNCWSLLANDLCKQAVIHNQMILRSNVTQRRDFISLSNFCRAIEHLIYLPTSQLKDGLFNIGGGWNPTIIDVAKILSDRILLLLDKEIDIKFKESKQKSSILSLHFDITKIKLTGFELIHDRNNEFDNLIRFCHTSFKV